MKNNLKRHRKNAGLTMQQLADEIGTCKSQIYTLEKIDSNPKLETAFLIAEALDRKVTDIWFYKCFHF